MVYFDDVLVPWERVFLMNDADLANRAYADTGAVLHMAHQVVNLKIAKTEAILGTMQAGVDMIGTGQYQHVQEMIAETIIVLEIMKALQVASEAGATINEYGVMTPPVARSTPPATSTPGVPAAGRDPAAGHVERADHDPDRGRLRRADGAVDREVPRIGRRRRRRARASDASGLGHDDLRFGGRQAHYENFFFGDPVRMRQALYTVYDRSEYVERVRRFVAGSDEVLPAVTGH